MRNLKRKIIGYGVGTLVAILILALLCGISWIVTCGVIKLITMCFGWTFKWSIATGIWLVMCLASNVFKTTVSK